MQPSAATCRIELARHLEASLNDPLPNRRAIATRAADAWRIEAARAEKREAGIKDPISIQDAQFAREFAEEALAEDALVETRDAD